MRSVEEQVDAQLERTGGEAAVDVASLGEQLLGTDDAMLVDAERQLDGPGAVARLLELPDLVRVLERYASDPVYRPAELGDAKLRVDTCSALLRRLAIRPELAGRARLLRRADEAIRIEAGALGPLRRIRVRRVRSSWSPARGRAAGPR